MRYRDTVKPSIVLERHKEAFEAGFKKLKAINKRLGFPVMHQEDRTMLEFYLTKVYRCGNAIYKFPEAEVLGSWNGKSYKFIVRSK